MTLRDYGSWSGIAFRDTLIGLSPTADTSEANIELEREDLEARGHYASFKEAFVHFLLDDTLSLKLKGDLYLDGMRSNGATWDYLKWLWDNLFPGEPWPLEGRPCPTD